MMKKRITLLGSTGSIGKSTLNILDLHKDQFEVVALTAKTNIDELFVQCQQFNPRYVVVEDRHYAVQLKEKIIEARLNIDVLSGQKALEEVAALPEVDYVMAAIVGAAGLLPTLAAVKAGKRILLANKEALIMSGALFMESIKRSGAILLPVDSEHNAIFQCMPPNYKTGEAPVGVDKIILTASGGPFRTLPLDQFSTIKPSEAIAHPTWNMGAKISVDSATMMNKGFEVIEAYWLFNIGLENIEVLIHPQSIIHSLVCYQDGSFLAQLGSPDMRTPIAYTLSWPHRITTSVKKLNLGEVGQLTFEPMDPIRFPCMKLAYQAIKEGGTASAILNAVNEVAVAAFLAGELPFTAIPSLIEEVLNSIPSQSASSFEVILEADKLARALATENITTGLLQ